MQGKFIRKQSNGVENPAFEHPEQNSKDPPSYSEVERTRKKSILHRSHSDLPHVLENIETGPVRKKSILHRSDTLDSGSRHINGDPIKKNSLSSVHSKTRFEDQQQVTRSWWYSFFVKCRSQESKPSWSPPLWEKICPYPFCPTYRQFSRIIALILIGTMSWIVLYSIVGKIAAPPSGQLFQLILLCICAHIGGWLMSLTNLPDLIGMLFTGLLLQNIQVVNLDASFRTMNRDLRETAIVIILIRAGLDLDPIALKRLKYTVLKLGLVPWLIEAGTTAILSRYIFGFTWDYAVLLGSIIAAVSPGIVVPCLVRLRAKGYGAAKGIPTLIIAVSGIDDATSIAVFGIIKSIMFSQSSLTSLVLQGPLSVVGGIGFGIIWGIICNFAPERRDPFMVPLRILLLLVGGLASVFGSELIGYGGAGPLGTVTAAFVCLVCWTRQGWEIEENPASTAFDIFWMIFQPILFGITGTQIKLNELDGNDVMLCIVILVVGIVIRILATILVGVGSRLNLKEKIFVSLSWMSKAGVQAALGPIALQMVKDPNSKEHEYAERILEICVLSIMLTAPLTGLLMTCLGSRLLTKTKIPPPVSEGWRRSHRPSIYDISIINEEEDDVDKERSDELQKSEEDLSERVSRPHQDGDRLEV